MSSSITAGSASELSFFLQLQAVENVSLTLSLKDGSIHWCVSPTSEESRVQKSSAGLYITPSQDIYSAGLGELWGKV